MIEVAHIFRQHGEAYRSKYPLSVPQLKAMRAIESCRTSELGGHVDQCDECGHLEISYNSCRNRHCPKCQSLPKERWLDARIQDLLPIGYFHIVFTLPHDLKEVARRNKKVIYSLLLKTSAETLLELAADPKYLGARIGFISILHTWGQNLMYHPHVHCIVTGGGLSKEGGRWVSSKKDYFLPVRVMSSLYKGKFLCAFKKSCEKQQIKTVDNATVKIATLYKQEWVVYCKAPFRSAEYVLKYLGRYTHRVAISNHRLCKSEGGRITFKWRDYKDNNRNKMMTIEADEFIRRFLLHILPNRFVKIRHYGILSSRNKEKLEGCKELLNPQGTKRSTTESKKKETWNEFLLRVTGTDHSKCPCCGRGTMVLKKTLSKGYHGKAKYENSA